MNYWRKFLGWEKKLYINNMTLTNFIIFFLKKNSAINKVAEKTDNWILPVMYMVARELRKLSMLVSICIEKKKIF